MTMKLFPTLGKCLWAIILAIPVAAAQQEKTPDNALAKTELPSESSLPGQVVGSPQGPAVTDLPDESRLPNTPFVDTPDLAGNDTDILSIRELASESDLPSTWIGNFADNENHATDVPLSGASPDEIGRATV